MSTPKCTHGDIATSLWKEKDGTHELVVYISDYMTKKPWEERSFKVVHYINRKEIKSVDNINDVNTIIALRDNIIQKGRTWDSDPVKVYYKSIKIEKANLLSQEFRKNIVEKIEKNPVRSLPDDWRISKNPYIDPYYKIEYEKDAPVRRKHSIDILYIYKSIMCGSTEYSVNYEPYHPEKEKDKERFHVGDFKDEEKAKLAAYTFLNLLKTPKKRMEFIKTYIPRYFDE